MLHRCQNLRGFFSQSIFIMISADRVNRHFSEQNTKDSNILSFFTYTIMPIVPSVLFQAYKWDVVAKDDAREPESGWFDHFKSLHYLVEIVNKRISWNLIRFPDYTSHKNQKKNSYKNKYKQYKYNEACFRIIKTQIVTLFSWKLSIPSVLMTAIKN